MMEIAGIIVAQLVLSALVVLLGAWSLRKVDRLLSAGSPEPPPDQIDPYELAFLTGGERVVIVVAAYKLLKERLLNIIVTPAAANRDLKEMMSLDDATLLRRLSPIDFAVLEYFREGRTLSTALELNLPQTIHAACQPYSLFLKAERLLAPNETFAFAARLRILATLVIFALAAYAAVAVYHFRLDFVPATVAIGMIAFASAYRFCRARRVTGRGQAYLSLLRRECVTSQSLRFEDPSERAATIVALFGWNHLHNPDDDEFRTLLQHSGAGLSVPSWRDAYSQRAGGR